MYDINVNVEYNNNAEFRECLRKTFNMKCIEDKNNKDLDKESRDELLYDDKSVSKSLTFILDITQNNQLFKDIYLIAAGRVFSTDLGIGLSILFSYDNFKLFHLLLKEYLSNPSQLKQDNKYYIDLKNHII